MRLLFLSDFCPWPLDNGYRQRIYHLVLELSRHHEVTLATVMPRALRGQPFPPAEHCVDLIPLSTEGCDFNHTKRFERWAPFLNRVTTLFGSPLPNMIRRWRSVEILATLKELHKHRTYDAVWAERPYIAELAKEAGFKRIVVDLPDIESQLFERVLSGSGWYWSKPLHWVELAKLYVYEQLMPLRFWRLVPCKDEDRRFFRLKRSNVIVLPNGVPEYPASPAPLQTATPKLLWIGALDYESNIDAVTFFVTAILPLIRRDWPGVQFVVVGRRPSPELQEFLTKHGATVLSDVAEVEPYFESASLFVAPIRLGSGTRLKVLEALIRQKAVVATSVAAEGLNVRNGVDLEIADTAEAFAAACCRLLADDDRRRAMSGSARTRVLSQYLWERLLPITEVVLNDLTKPRHSTPAI